MYNFIKFYHILFQYQNIENDKITIIKITFDINQL